MRATPWPKRSTLTTPPTTAAGSACRNVPVDAQPDVDRARSRAVGRGVDGSGDDIQRGGPVRITDRKGEPLQSAPRFADRHPVGVVGPHDLDRRLVRQLTAQVQPDRTGVPADGGVVAVLPDPRCRRWCRRPRRRRRARGRSGKAVVALVGATQRPYRGGRESAGVTTHGLDTGEHHDDPVVGVVGPALALTTRSQMPSPVTSPARHRPAEAHARRCPWALRRGRCAGRTPHRTHRPAEEQSTEPESVRRHVRTRSTARDVHDAVAVEVARCDGPSLAGR